VGFLSSEYDTIKYQITRNLNKKNTSRRVTAFDTVPNELENYKTERYENLMIFKNSNIIIFQSPF